MYLGSLDLKTFSENAISPSMLRSFEFCEAQPIVKKRARDLGLRLRGMKVGASRHKVDLSWWTGVGSASEYPPENAEITWIDS